MQYTVDLVAKVDPVALYAAVLSTLIFCWELYKWFRRGPKLRGSVSSNMKLYGPLKDDSTYLCFKVWNIGTERTTINNVALCGYKTWWHRIRQKHGLAAVVTGGGHGQSAPYVLEVGKEFMTLGRQDEKLEKWTREYRFYGAVYHSFSKRPLLLRIKPIPPQDETKAS